MRHFYPYTPLLFLLYYDYPMNTEVAMKNTGNIDWYQTTTKTW